jgi:succinoglycan biosynthesis transport protein ExoP
LLLEFTNRRVRSAEDLVQMLELPVLASISSRWGPARLSGPRRLMLGNGGTA